METRRLPRYRAPHVPNFHKLVQVVAGNAKRIALTQIQAFANTSAQRFKKRILDQDFVAFDATPLSPKYAAWKAAAGLDPRVMVATRNYVENIDVTVQHLEGGAKLVYVGFRKDAQVRDMDGNIVPIHVGDITGLRALALVQEKGSEKVGIPPRAHWEPERARVAHGATSVRPKIVKDVVHKSRQDLKKVL